MTEPLVATRRFLTVNETNELYGGSRPFWRKQIRHGDIPFYKVGTRVLLVRDDVEAFFAKRRRSGKADSKNSAKYADAIRVAVRRVAREWTGKKPVTEIQVVQL